MLTVSFDPAKTTVDALGKKLALVGHDTEKYKAPDDVYAKLPGCCHYDREKENKHVQSTGKIFSREPANHHYSSDRFCGCGICDNAFYLKSGLLPRDPVPVDAIPILVKINK